MVMDNKLTQEEIDALLNVTDDSTSEITYEDESNTYLTPLEMDALGEIGNISFGSSATTLSTLLNQKVDITTPTVSFVKKTGIKEEFPYEHVSLQVDYCDGFDGENIFLMKAKDAAIISDIMLGGNGLQPNEELSEIELSAVQEAMNQMMGSSATSMSTVFNKRVDISPPQVDYKDIDKLEEVAKGSDEDVLVRVAFNLKIGDLIDSNIFQLIPLDFAKDLVNQLLEPTEEPINQETTMKDMNIAQQSDISVTQTEVETAQMEQPTPTQSEPQHIGNHIAPDSTIQHAAFEAFEPTPLNQTNKRNLDMLLDVPLSVTVELGRTKQTVEDILELSQGAIIELDKLAGEPVDVLVNNKLIAKGEVVVIDENFGVRVTDIVSPKDRLMKLN
ncbi:MAG TPA: flagellar motor switch phosphatase FliY [Candidatus Pseudogracilibacillus intestinigallinarum]|uniref:Flagellar motor switch phosphatase FliY n=1 Tax=Candidatus Pseudogracilibacillus intestinigallinarum TaxID=2838742 RepID=A0A9D1PPE5_9BACI|nr:flagellar motor switch phosphatase FliY [Candidatus Pseudogracilibacillus intestinigallinarum]